jgi:hypothetical protein
MPSIGLPPRLVAQANWTVAAHPGSSGAPFTGLALVEEPFPAKFVLSIVDAGLDTRRHFVSLDQAGRPGQVRGTTSST